MKPTIKVYSKICLSCHDDRWAETRAKLMADYAVKEYRTALNPLWHAKAKKLADTEDYAPFIVFDDGSIKTVKEVEDGEEKEMPKVRRNATAKPIRDGRVARKKSTAKKKVEG